MKNKLYTESYPWMAAQMKGENPQAMFRDPSVDMPIKALDSLPSELATDIGKNCGRRILPYRLQDRYGRDRQIRNFQSVVLENEILKAVFLPELGGRLISLFHKPTQRELLFKNPVFQPANLALRDAWFAGGIEWNIGQFGHSHHTSSPIFAGAIPGIDGSQALRLYDFDRCHGLLWQIDFHLPPGAEFLYAFTRVTNPSKEEALMYWWTNTAVPESPDVRVLAPASKSLFVDYRGGGLSYGEADLPGLSTMGGQDGTYSVRVNFTSEFYLQCQSADLPWQAALDKEGSGFIEASTHPLNIRKLFCWGSHAGGVRWKEFLSVPDQPYIEIQSGLSPTQQHITTIPGNSQKQWVQAFGYLKADPTMVHSDDWAEAWQSADATIKQHLGIDQLTKIEETCVATADLAPTEILHRASGWGALEQKRRLTAAEPDFSPAFLFPDSSLGEEQEKWLNLLQNGTFPTQDPARTPGEWMIQSEWMQMLEQCVSTPTHSTQHHGFALLHLGVMKFEHGDEAGAIAAWEESVKIWPSPWGWRNLAAAATRRGKFNESLPLYQKAWDLACDNGVPDVSFALEYLAALHHAGENHQAWQFYQSLHESLKSQSTIHLLAAKVAFELDDLSFVEAALDLDYTSIREGASDLSDLWFGLQAKRIQHQENVTYDTAYQRALTTCIPPQHLDFRIEETFETP